MASQKRKSRERRQEARSEENNNDKKKKSNKGCYGKKNKKRAQSNGNIDVTDASAPSFGQDRNALPNSGRNNQFGSTSYNDRNTNPNQNLNRNIDFDGNRNVNSYRNQNDPGYSYNYHASGFNNATDMNPVPAPRKNVAAHESNHQNIDGRYDVDNHQYIPDNHYRDKNASRYSVNHQMSTSNDNVGEDSEREITETVERKIITKKGAKKIEGVSNTNKGGGTQSYVRGDSNEHFKRFHRSSIISKISSSFSSGSSSRNIKEKSFQIHGQQNVKEVRSLSASAGNTQNRQVRNEVTVQKSLGSLENTKQISVSKKPIPVLKTNKSYNITFAMHAKAPAQNLSKETHVEVNTLQTVESKNIRAPRRKKSSKRIQTESDYVDSGLKKEAAVFSPLMKDVHINERKAATKNRVSISAPNNDMARNNNEMLQRNSAMGQNNNAIGRNSNFMAQDNSYMIRENNAMNRNSNLTVPDNGYMVRENYAMGRNNNAMASNSYNVQRNSYSYGGNNNGIYTDNNSAMRGANYSSNAMNYALDNIDMGDAVYTTESKTYKEWFEIEYPDGKREKREYRKEINNEGDTNYVDIQNGNVLKIDKASWKSGEELIKKKKKIESVRYQWRQDPGTNEWVKYNADTNEVLKRGDWKSGNEWYRNSKGKLAQRHYIYIKGADGRWVKSDSSSGVIVDYSNCSALKGYSWIPTKKSGYGKTKNGRWKKQEYEYIQNNKGKWVKQEIPTKKRLAKPSSTGWKEGKDYNMDGNGRVKKVKYVWSTGNDGFMQRVNKKTKKPINTNWKQGREVIMKDNNVVTNNYSWVKNGRNKWVKVDEDTGKALSNNIKSNKIATYNQSLTKGQTYTTQTSRRMDDKLIEENTKLEQNGGVVVKNTTKTIKY